MNKRVVEAEGQVLQATTAQTPDDSQVQAQNSTAFEQVAPDTIQFLSSVFPRPMRATDFLKAVLTQAQVKQVSLSGLAETANADVAVITTSSIRKLSEDVHWGYDSFHKYVKIFCALNLFIKYRYGDQIEIHFPLRPYKIEDAPVENLDALITEYRPKLRKSALTVQTYVRKTLEEQAQARETLTTMGVPEHLKSPLMKIQNLLQITRGVKDKPRLLENIATIMVETLPVSQSTYQIETPVSTLLENKEILPARTYAAVASSIPPKKAEKPTQQSVESTAIVIEDHIVGFNHEAYSYEHDSSPPKPLPPGSIEIRPEKLRECLENLNQEIMEQMTGMFSNITERPQEIIPARNLQKDLSTQEKQILSSGVSDDQQPTEAESIALVSSSGEDERNIAAKPEGILSAAPDKQQPTEAESIALVSSSGEDERNIAAKPEGILSAAPDKQQPTDRQEDEKVLDEKVLFANFNLLGINTNVNVNVNVFNIILNNITNVNVNVDNKNNFYKNNVNNVNVNVVSSENENRGEETNNLAGRRVLGKFFGTIFYEGDDKWGIYTNSFIKNNDPEAIFAAFLYVLRATYHGKAVKKPPAYFISVCGHCSIQVPQELSELANRCKSMTYREILLEVVRDGDVKYAYLANKPAGAPDKPVTTQQPAGTTQNKPATQQPTAQNKPTVYQPAEGKPATGGVVFPPAVLPERKRTGSETGSLDHDPFPRKKPTKYDYTSVSGLPRPKAPKLHIAIEEDKVVMNEDEAFNIYLSFWGDRRWGLTYYRASVVRVYPKENLYIVLLDSGNDEKIRQRIMYNWEQWEECDNSITDVFDLFRTPEDKENHKRMMEQIQKRSEERRNPPSKKEEEEEDDEQKG
jgi:hypothetical protein